LVRSRGRWVYRGTPCHVKELKRLLCKKTDYIFVYHTTERVYYVTRLKKSVLTKPTFRPKFVPQWIPDGVIVGLTLAVQVAIVLAVYATQRKQARRPRLFALWLLALSVIVIGGEIAALNVIRAEDAIF